MLDRTQTPRPVWLTTDNCDLDAFVADIAQTVDPADYPFADRVDRNVPVYEAQSLRKNAADPVTRAEVKAEFVRIMRDGPGIVTFRHAFPAGVVDSASDAFNEILAAEKAAGSASGDHFAPPGANDRLWRAQQKLAEHAPEAYFDYYANPLLALVCEAWLGPMYQVTSDLNIVNPGGKAQNPHRDYHLGFMSPETAQRFPAHVHALSPVLTLQGAVAHCDMPMESGPTQYLPFSQRCIDGFLGIQREDFRHYFAEHYVQLPLAKGDAVFFNPALFHAAGDNRTTDTYRMANLLQVSSAFGRALGTIDRAALCRALYPTLRRRYRQGQYDAVECAIAASAEGYGFPANLDRNQPIGGLSPETQAEMVRRALAEDLPPETFAEQLETQAWRQRTGD